MSIKGKTPIRVTKNTRPEDLEKIFRGITDDFHRLDGRRIAQVNTVSAGSTDSESISNLITAFNNLAAALNGSDFTVD